jgi:hypothetical protein
MRSIKLSLQLPVPIFLFTLTKLFSTFKFQFAVRPKKYTMESELFFRQIRARLKFSYGIEEADSQNIF